MNTPQLADVLFYIGAVAVFISGAWVVISKNPLHSALALILTLTSQAFLYVLLDGSFIASMQLIVYAGAIMVLFVFVIMLLNVQSAHSGRFAWFTIAKVIGASAILYIVAHVVRGVSTAEQYVAKTIPSVDGSVKSIGILLLTKHLFVFEAISVLLLVAVVGAVVLGLKRLS